MVSRTKIKPIDPTTQDGKILQDIMRALYNKEPLSGPDGVITRLLKSAMEGALSGELEAHLEETVLDEDNRRNGTSVKTMKSKYGEL